MRGYNAVRPPEYSPAPIYKSAYFKGRLGLLKFKVNVICHTGIKS